MTLDRITRVCVNFDGEHKVLSKEEWLEVNVPIRVQLILRNKVKFLCGAEEIQVRDALKLLKN